MKKDVMHQKVAIVLMMGLVLMGRNLVAQEVEGVRLQLIF